MLKKGTGCWQCRAEARKEALAKAAEEMRESGKTASAFAESPYAVSEDKSPNVHTRQVWAPGQCRTAYLSDLLASNVL